jgi:ABC-type uncharacterized transport system substrate-binding protein
VLFNPITSPYNALWMRAIETAAPGFSVSTFQVSVQSDKDIRRAFDTMRTKPGSGLIVPSDSFTFERAALIASQAMDGRIPAVYAFPRFAHEGGLISYGIDLVEQLGKSAVYVDRILKGEKPGELPVQAPTRYTMTINLKTAKAFGLTIASGLIASADGGDRMRRREFIAALGSVAAWPLAARAQQRERVRHIGILMNADDPDLRSQHAAFLQFLKELGWIDGRNVQIDTRWSKGPADIRRYAMELAARAPDVIVVIGTAGMSPMLEATRTVPIVFANVADPVGAGFVRNMAHPGGNVTGFVQLEYSLSGKWPELLKQIAPDLTRIAVLRDPTITSGIGQFAVIESVAPSLGKANPIIEILNANKKLGKIHN